MTQMKTERGLDVELDDNLALPYARLMEDDRRLIKILIYALGIFITMAVIGIGVVTVDLLTRDRERQDTVTALADAEQLRRINFELMTDYVFCVVRLTHLPNGDPRLCPRPKYVPPPGEVERVPTLDDFPSDIPFDQGGGGPSSSGDDGLP